MIEQEIKAFKDAQLWGDGFMDADPLLPLSWSSYSSTGFVSVYHAIYLACIRPYMPAGARVMEIGPGLGAWTRALIERGASRVYALDVQPRSADGIDRLLGPLIDRLTYIEVSDFEGEGVPDGEIDFFWTFGTFVHLSIEAQAAYLRTISRKLRPGAHGFIQFADMDVWNRVVTDSALHIHEWIGRVIGGEKGEAIKQELSTYPVIAPRETIPEHVRNWSVIAPGRYFYVGTERLSTAIADAGLEVVERNVLSNLRDPVIHFRKP